jgi:MSHA biogenesis protein MshM
MYLEHFGLSEAPFRITPHTEFFFAGANRGATLDALIYSIVHNEGIVKVSGEVGSGKTMLCRVLMERLPDQVVVVYLANPTLARDDIVFAIADELELEIPEQIRPSAVLRVLQNRLIELHGAGRQVIALIDEAHAMPKETLEEIRLLSNLETSQHKLLQLVLFGQPELDDILARPDMRQLRERITQNFSLEPLRRDDIAQYLDFRMRTAGYRGPEVFSSAAIKLIASASQGLTRRVNILAEKSLLAAFAESTHQITPKQVEAAIRDSQYQSSSWNLHKSRPVLAALGAATLLSAVAVIATRGSQTAPSVPTVANAETPTARLAEPSPATPSLPSTSPARPPAAKAVSGEPANTAATTAPRLEAAAQDRLEETRQWLATVANDRWFIQLTAASADQSGYAQQYLARADTLLHPDQARLYVADLGTEQRIGVIYGDFPSRRVAAEAIERLPAELRTNKPFPRQARWLK